MREQQGLQRSIQNDPTESIHRAVFELSEQVDTPLERRRILDEFLNLNEELSDDAVRNNTGSNHEEK